MDDWVFLFLIQRCSAPVIHFPDSFGCRFIIFYMLIGSAPLQHKDFQSFFSKLFCGPASADPRTDHDCIINCFWHKDVSFRFMNGEWSMVNWVFSICNSAWSIIELIFTIHHSPLIIPRYTFCLLSSPITWSAALAVNAI